jgi:cbb3-type cytochrome oxidase subunit 3
MSNKILLKFVVAFGVLAILLMFLGVNYVPRISALSSAKKNAVDAAKNAGSDYIERHPSIVAKPVYNAGAEVTGADMKIAPVFDVTGAVVSDPTCTLLIANQSGDRAVPVTGTDMKIAPVFDATGAIVSDPTGTMLSVINP